MPSDKESTELVRTVVNSTSNVITSASNVVTNVSNAVCSTVNITSTNIKDIMVSVVECRKQYLQISKEIEICKTNANLSLEKIRETYDGKKKALNSLSLAVESGCKNLEKVDVKNLDDKTMEYYKVTMQGLMYLADKITTLYNTLD